MVYFLNVCDLAIKHAKHFMSAAVCNDMV